MKIINKLLKFLKYILTIFVMVIALFVANMLDRPEDNTNKKNQNTTQIEITQQNVQR